MTSQTELGTCEARLTACDHPDVGFTHEPVVLRWLLSCSDSIQFAWQSSEWAALWWALRWSWGRNRHHHALRFASEKQCDRLLRGREKDKNEKVWAFSRFKIKCLTLQNWNETDNTWDNRSYKPRSDNMHLNNKQVLLLKWMCTFSGADTDNLTWKRVNSQENCQNLEFAAT